MSRIAELVKSHSQKSTQRLETVASALKLSTSRSAHTMQDFGSRTSEQLTTIGQRGSRFYQNSELFAADVSKLKCSHILLVICARLVLSVICASLRNSCR